jgi:hypothetical protein
MMAPPEVIAELARQEGCSFDEALSALHGSDNNPRKAREFIRTMLATNLPMPPLSPLPFYQFTFGVELQTKPLTPIVHPLDIESARAAIEAADAEFDTWTSR